MKVWAASSLAPGTYHWRDFFVPADGRVRSTSGPYRFLSNPMYTVGYAHAYGVAVFLRSAPGLWAAAIAQDAILLLMVTVERPHVLRLPARGAAAGKPRARSAPGVAAPE